SFAGKAASAHRPDHQGPRLSVVILCAGASSADKTLLDRLSVRLADAGMVIEGEAQPVLSLEWARRVEQQIRAADAVVPLLSAGSIHSEIMAYALEVAQQAARRSNHLPRLVPLSIGLTSPFPRQIGLALDDAPVIPIDPETSAEG